MDAKLEIINKKQEQINKLLNEIEDLKAEKSFADRTGVYHFEPAKYDLDESMFSTEIINAIESISIIEKSSLRDWWQGTRNGLSLSWAELIELAAQILTNKATELLCQNVYVEKHDLPQFVFREYTLEELPDKQISGAKRVNANADTEYLSQQPDKDKFLLHGKDSSCYIEGMWLDWVCFAMNILASENTKIVAPEMYAPELKNENY